MEDYEAPFYFDILDICGCAEEDFITPVLIKYLKWFDTHIEDREKQYDEEFEPGEFYLISALLDRSGLLEHGTSCRGAWTTSKGSDTLKRLLALTS